MKRLSVTAADRPSRAMVDKLIKAYALMKYSGLQNAPMKVQQRLHKAYMKMLDKLIAKYPKVDMRSPQFQASMDSHATQWWNKRPFSGPGTDW